MNACESADSRPEYWLPGLNLQPIMCVPRSGQGFSRMESRLKKYTCLANVLRFRQQIVNCVCNLTKPRFCVRHQGPKFSGPPLFVSVISHSTTIIPRFLTRQARQDIASISPTTRTPRLTTRQANKQQATDRGGEEQRTVLLPR